MWHKTLSTASRSNFFNASKASALKNAARPSFAPLARHISTDAQMLNTGLDSVDPQTFAIIENEKIRQLESINLIPSENFTSRAVLECLGSVMQNKYSEGYPKARYYGGNQFIDESESLCQQRALEAFDLDPEKWGVNVQLYSGSPANFAVFAALVEPHQRIMGLDLPHGGHLTHGFQTDNKKISMTSKFWETMPYRLDIKTGCIDYDELEFLATRFKPKLLISGCTAYSRIVDTARFREIADKCGAILHYDLAHISGLVAGGALPSPFEHADVVSTTTHKSLRGPRGAMIFYRKGQKGTTKKGQPIMYDLENKIKETVFPGLQGGPHNHTITALSTALKMANTAEFKEYQNQVIKNSKALAGKLQDLGYDIVSGGTDNHMCLVDLTNMGLSGAKGERICELTNIVLNKNTVPHDKSAMNPSGLRIGTPAMTSRGLVEKDFEAVAEFLDRAVKVGLDVQRDSGKKLDDFTKTIVENEPAPVSLLRKDVAEFASSFEPIGFSLDGASGSASGSARSSQSASA